MTKRFVLVAGNIGSGKTSLTERLGERLNWQTSFESVADNPYLADFYDDMRAWAFHLQIYFLGHRAEQHLNLAGSSQSAIADRSIYEDLHIFSRASFTLGNVSERDYLTYQQMYSIVVRNLPSPDLLLYLQAPVGVLMDRIRQRGRTIESSLSEDYLALLDRYYQDWIESYDLSPVLRIHSDDLDFVHKPQHLDIVIARMEDYMAGKEELYFPKD